MKTRFKVVPFLLLFALPAAVEAQFQFVTNNGAITITAYAGPGGAVTIPGTINGWPVTNIGDEAFWNCRSLSSVTIPGSVICIGVEAFLGCYSLPSVTIPNSVTSIGDGAFAHCYSLTSVSIPNSVTNIGDVAFAGCSSLTNATIGNSVTSIGGSAFSFCTNLTSVTIGNSVTSIGSSTFWSCTSLAGVYFKSDAPTIGTTAFFFAPNVTVYYLPGTTGWGSTFGGVSTAPWFLPNPLILNNRPSFGVQSNRFGFTISWATNLPVMVEACTNLSNQTWSPVGTNILICGCSYFSDPQWTNYPARFYRLRSP